MYYAEKFDDIDDFIKKTKKYFRFCNGKNQDAPYVASITKIL